MREAQRQLCRIAGAAAILTAAAAAQWIALDGPFAARAAPDTVRNRVVAIGSEGGTWQWDGVQRLHLATTGPGPRVGAAMAFDAVRGHVLVFGGNAPNANNAFGDTWLWDGVAWSQPFSLVAPARRTEAAAVFDAGRGRIVLCGGRDPNASLSTDVFEHDGVQWHRIVPQGPGPTAGSASAIAYSPTLGEVVLVLLPSSRPQTWSWNGTRWALVASGGPVSSLPGGMAFDPVRARFVLLVVEGGAGRIWELQGSFWSAGPLVSELGLRQANLWFDPARGAVVIHGGRRADSGNSNHAMWSWDGVAVRPIAAAHGPEPRGHFAAAHDPLRRRSIVFGGSVNAVNRDDLWEWDGQQWRQRLLPMGPSPRERAAACFDAARGATLLFGGITSTPLQETWALDGGGWTLLQPGSVPPPRYASAITWDDARGRAVLFAGRDLSAPFADTWEWDGVDWIARNPAVSPPARYEHAMAFDPRRNRTVLHGGRASTSVFLTDTWEWNGAQWTQVQTASTPGNTVSAGMAFDPVADRIALLRMPPTPLTAPVEIWHYDGVEWVLAETLPPATNRGSRALLLDPARGRLLSFDGEALRERSATPAGVAATGQGCGSPPPRIAARTRPRIGQSAFGLELWTHANAPVLWILGHQPASTPVGGGCTLLVQSLATTFVLADATGLASQPIPLASPALRGLSVLCQAGALDAAAPAGFVLSSVLQIVVGD